MSNEWKRCAMCGWYDVRSSGDQPACKVYVDRRGCVTQAMVGEEVAAPAVSDGNGRWMPIGGVALWEFTKGYGKAYGLYMEGA